MRFFYKVIVCAFLAPLGLATAAEPGDDDAVAWWEIKSLEDSRLPAQALLSLDHYIGNWTETAAREDVRFAAAIRERARLHQLLGMKADDTSALWNAISIDSDALGPDHPIVAYDHLALGDQLLARNQPEAARSEFFRAATIIERVLGPADPATAAVFDKLASALGPLKLLARHEFGEAIHESDGASSPRRRS
jgi:hypothetical protein